MDAILQVENLTKQYSGFILDHLYLLVSIFMKHLPRKSRENFKCSI